MGIEWSENLDFQRKEAEFKKANNDARLFNVFQMDLARICNNGELNDQQFMEWTRLYSDDFRDAFKEVFFNEDDFMAKAQKNRQVILKKLLDKTFEMHLQRVGHAA